MVVDAAAILGAHVTALPVSSGWVYMLKEAIQQLGVVGLLGVIVHLQSKTQNGRVKVWATAGRVEYDPLQYVLSTIFEAA